MLFLSYLSVEEREGRNAILASVCNKIGPSEDCLWMILKGLKNVSCSTNKVAAYYAKDYSRSIFFAGCPITCDIIRAFLLLDFTTAILVFQNELQSTSDNYQRNNGFIFFFNKYSLG